jgi:hypothetical protein
MYLIVQSLSDWLARRQAEGKSVGELASVAARMHLLTEEVGKLAAAEDKERAA